MDQSVSDGHDEGSSLHGILFDFAFTLFQPPSPLALLQSAGLDPADAIALWEEIWRQADVAAAAGERDLCPEGHRREWIRLLEPADAVAPGLSHHLYEMFAKPTSWVPYPGVASALRQLREKGYRLGLVSNIAYDLRPVVRAHGLGAMFDAVVLSFEVGVQKPHPEIFRAAARQMGVDPRACLMVGDSPHADGGAESVGMATLIVPGARMQVAGRISLLEQLVQLPRSASRLAGQSIHEPRLHPSHSIG
jgi:HAD superfamily hydrolase (TIGR01509 family)